jgi:hypothetical protein
MISKSTVRRWNKRFNDSDKAGKRVLIAKDVIEQIQLGLYKPRSSYVVVKTKLDLDEDFQRNVDRVKCECCGVGACFVSLVKFTNNATVREVDRAFDDYSDLADRLAEFFSKKQLALIEHIFEMKGIRRDWEDQIRTRIGGYWEADFTVKEVLKLDETQKLYKGSPKKRLIQIMMNIVRNNGTFKPHQG